MSAQLYKANRTVFLFYPKKVKAIKKIAFVLLFFGFATKAFSATKTPIISGNWSSIATWGGTLPAPGDDIIINDGTTLTVDGNYTCKSVGFSGTGGTGTLNVNAGFKLTVTTDISCPISTADVKINANYVLGGLGSISCVNLNVNNTVVPSASNTTTITVISTISNMLVSGDITINSTVNQVNKTNNGTFNIQTGTVTVAGTITTVNVANQNSSIIDMVTGSNSPTLILSGPTPFNLMNKGNSLLNANGTGATVNYSYPGAETVLGTTNGSNTVYTNLVLSGSGVKKLSNGITVNGTLSMQGTATTSGSTPTYGTSATLEYKGSTAQTTSDIEYPVLGTPAPNLRIDNSLGVTLNDSKKVTGTLTFANGLLTTGTNKISITTTGSVSGAGPGKYIYGNEEIFYLNALNPSEKFDIGDATTYAPATIAFSGTTTGSGSLTASTSAGDHTDIENSGIDSAASVNRTWTITKSSIAGFTSYDATFNYAATDIDAGANPASFIVRKLSGTWGTTNLVAAGTLSTEANGMTSFGTFQVGQIDVLAIDVQPDSHPGCIGYSTTFSIITGSLPNPAVKWQRADASGVFTDITSTTDGGVYTNFTSTTLIISNVSAALNNYKYRAILTNINGTITSTAATLTTTVPPSAAIAYAGTPFCTTVTTGQPVSQTGTTGGTYSSIAGLSLDGVTGAITPSSSAAGSYTVSYTIDAFGGCPTYTVTTPVTLTAAPSAAIYYAGSPFCTTVTTAQPVTRTGNTGGTYSSTAGLIINNTTGAITPSSSTPGTYTVTYTVPAANGCAQYSTTTIVNITQAPSATISYAGSPYCVTVSTLQPVTRTGTTTGIFSAPSGLSIDPTNGDIMPASSTPGTYTVTYTVSAYAGCAAYTTTTSVTIADIPSASITYPGSPFCTSTTTAQPVSRSGTAGGTYSSTTGLAINASTGAITPSASTPGTYTVTYTAASACGTYAFATTVNISQAPSASISYAGTPFCKTISSPQPVSQSGTSGGTYSSSAGLTIDPSTGEITPSTSTAGTYTVTYTVPASNGCGAFTTTTTIAITNPPSATISYAGTPFCTTVTTAQSVTRTGTTGGTYSSSTGLTINSLTGAITPSTSTPGTYTVTYTIGASAGCSVYTATTTVTITSASASIFYDQSPFCSSDPAAQNVTLTGNPGGTFSSTAGLSIDPSTGDIVPAASTPGTYTVTYFVAAAGGCASFSTTTSVTVTPAPYAIISYTASAFCTTVTLNQPVKRTGNASGTYSASPGGLTISSTTGAIKPSTSTPGTYTVTYTVPAAGGCGAFFATTTVTITAAPSGTISYSGTPFCTSLTSAQPVTQTATAGGSFSAPAGLSIDATTGAITPSASTPGTYTVTYTLAASGGCAAFSTTTSVTITQAPSATISYAGTPFCTSVSGAQQVTRTGTSGGTYSAPTGLSINATTGAITASSSTPGTYTVSYSLAASGGCATFSVTTSVTITAAPSATISYTANPFCASVAGSIAVTRSGTAGGTFSAGTGLTIDATTGTITPSTSTPGTYTVTYAIAAAGGCTAFSTTTSVTITQTPSATISYSGTPFCTSLSGTQAVTRTGTSGGTYSAPAGLSLNTTTGVITASSSTGGTYTVTYTIAAGGGCAAFSTTTSVTITAAPSATISYAGNPFCTSVAGAISATRSGTTGGTFSATTGLSINPTTGDITPSTSTAGTYTVTYSIAASGGCAAFSTTTSVTITKAPSATISYAGTPFCTSVTAAQPVTIAGSTGGTFSSTAGLSIDATTGAITPSLSTAGTYTVTYKIAASGGCAAFSTTTTVVITIGASATITYAGSPFCKTVATAQPVTRSGTAGGTYSSTTGLSIDPTTGAITPSTSTPGTYTVSYLVPASGGCGTYSTTTSVTITAVPSASISYTGSPYCKSITIAQSVTRTGVSGGTYSSTAGLSINATTGAIAPSVSTAGTYTVTYTVAASGGCAAYSTTTSVTITAAPSATISYAGNPFCKTVATAQAVTLTGTAGGTYSSTTGLTINSATGAITPSTSTAGTYTVTYTVAASAACAAYTTTTSVTITNPPSATISYSGTPFCTSITTAQAVTQTGTPGGTYSSTAGLSINGTTGAITPSTSTAGTYTVTYTVAASGGCAAYSTTTSVTITTAPSAAISYSPGSYCTTGTTAQAVTRTGTAGGTYTSTTGLSVSSTTGAITPSLSVPGTYTVTYSIAASGGCVAYSTTATVTISTTPSAAISYSGSPFCTTLSGTVPVTQTGAAGGTYSSTAGLSINTTTGAITPSASSAGTYTVTYTVPPSGGCAAFSTVTTVTIIGSSATISYSAASFCTSVATAQAVTRTGTAGGTFSSTAGLSITSTGSITPSTSTAGTYTVSYTLPSSGGCGVYVASTTVTITKAPSATISYTTSPFCTTEGDQFVTLTGTTGGVFTSTAGLSVNSSTGTINPSLSTAGTYTVTYSIAASGGCAAFSTTASVVVTQGKTATISYAGNPFCETSSGFATVTLTGTTGGTFSAPSALSMDASGTIKLNKSIRGDYVVSYTIAATGGCSAYTTTTPFNLNQAAVATIGYPGTTICSNTTTPQAVTLTGDVGGTFSATSGLNVDPTSGAVTPYPSPAGTYTVSYKVTNGCGSFTTSATVTIKTAPYATISYSGSPYCGAISTSQAVTRTGTAGGTYSSTPGLTIDANTGAISPFESSAGTYTVTYTVTNGGSCAYYATTTVTIFSISSSSISYDAPAFCNSDNTVHAVIQDGATNGTFSAPAGLDINAKGGITPSSSIPGNYTITYTVPATGACPSYKAFAAVTITEIPSASMDFTGSPYCTNGGTASVTLEGTSGGVFSSTSGLSIDPATGTITLGTSKAGTYTVNYSIAASGGCDAFSASTPVEIDVHAIWNGSVSRNWHDANNWSCGGVPTLTSDAVIPSGLTNYPIIYSGIATTHDITIQTGASVIDSGALKIAGTIYNSDIGSINALAGKVELATTSAQVIPSNLFYSKTIQDIVISNPAGVTLKGPLRVTGSVAFGNVNNCVFTTGDSLTLASIATSDAQVKDITNNGVNYGNVISGLVTVERYMPAKRAYRLLTAPVNSTGSIKANWMENSVNPDRWNRVNPFPGYGTNITGAGDVANGFDPTSTHNPSMFTFNSQTQAWVPLPNTSAPMSAGNAYRIIVRGDRAIDMNTNTPTPTITTLRATGKVVTGNVTFTKSGAGGPSGFANLSSVTNAYNLVANPYASAVNWLTVDKTDIAGTIWIFDPNIAGMNNRGGYVTYNSIIGTTVPTYSVADNYIQSGQAFFVQTAGPNPTIKFKETDKGSLYRSLFRTANTDPNLSVELLLPSQDGTASSTDGLKVFFSDQYTNSVSSEDSYKLSNQDENIAIARDKSYLSIEGRKPVVEADTIPISMWQLSQTNYLLKVNFTNFADNVEAYLEDKYLHLTSPLSTHGETTIPVNITSDAASFAADRYKIVFEAYATLPLHLLGVKAIEKNNGVDVGWIAESESNMDSYEIEKSADGQHFVTAGTVKARSNPGPSSSYSWFDLVPFDGDNYYRIKSVDKAGATKYSSITKVRITKGISGITVFPNPVHGKVITMRFSNIKQGSYSVRLINSTGEKVYEGVIWHDRGSGNHSVELRQVLPAGVYQMTISNGEDIETIRLVIR